MYLLFFLLFFFVFSYLRLRNFLPVSTISSTERTICVRSLSGWRLSLFRQLLISCVLGTTVSRNFLKWESLRNCMLLLFDMPFSFLSSPFLRGSASLLFCHFRLIVISGHELNALSCSCHLCHYVADCHYVGVCHVSAIPNEAAGALRALSRIPRTIGKASGERLCTRPNLMRSRADIRERHSLYLAGRDIGSIYGKIAGRCWRYLTEK